MPRLPRSPCLTGRWFRNAGDVGVVCLALLTGACATRGASTSTTESAAPPASTPPAPTPDAGASSMASDAGDAGSASAQAAPAAPLVGKDFVAQGKAIFRVAACGDDSPLPPKIDAAVVDEHCTALRELYKTYKTGWVEVAMPYIAALRPKNVPNVVVYPFGGGDLMSALATYPDFTELTTISLEAAGDARKIDNIGTKQLKAELGKNRLYLGKLFDKAHSRTVNLDLESKSGLPGGVVFMMVALAIHGYEPTSLRYFKLNPDGTPRYLEEADITAMEAAAAKKPKPDEAQLEIFKHVEIQLRKKGDSGPPRVFRHLAWSLDDKHLKADPSFLKHLEAKGKVSAMTKAASHLLWSDDFSLIRDYLLGHMEWMISDSTGVPPKYAQKAGFVQDTYGIMDWPEAFGTVDNKNAEDMKKLWKTNPQKDLPFRYGYPDNKHHGHMLITRKAGP